MNAAIQSLQAALSTLPQLAVDTQHHFADGMYLRWVFRPKGATIVGKVHKREHFYLCIQGAVRVNCGDGSAFDLVAPAIVVSKPGTKRAVHALEDSVCITVHRTSETDLECIEAELLEPDDTALFDAHNRHKIDVPAFRELTKRVIDAEKPGFWSNWTTEQQKFYADGDWLNFSRSRGYTEAQIDDYAEWRRQVAQAKNRGLNPYVCIADLAAEAAQRNIALDARGEIALSSHAPFESRVLT